MKKTVTYRYDVAEYLRTPEEMAAYLEACMEEAEGDAAFIAKALGDIARARGMTQVARDAGVSRESLYKALSGERTPGFDTILKVMAALGLKLHAEAVHIPNNNQQGDPTDARIARLMAGSGFKLRKAMENIVIADLSIPKHAEAVVYLLNEYAKDDMGGGVELADSVKKNLVYELKKRQGIFVVIAFVDEIPAGLAICIEGFSTFACKPLLNVHDMVVAPEYRGRGISKRLLAKAEAVAKNLGCCKLTLEVLEGNSIAQAAYKAFGFEGYELNPKMGKALFWQKKLT